MKLADFHSMFSVLFCTSAACSSMQYRVAKDEKQRGRISVVCGLCLCSPHHLWLVPLPSPPPVACASAIPIIRGLCFCSVLVCALIFNDRTDVITAPQKALSKRLCLPIHLSVPYFQMLLPFSTFKKSFLKFPFHPSNNWILITLWRLKLIF